MSGNNRKGISLLTVIAVLAFCLWATNGYSQRVGRSRLGGGADLTIASKYIWRGYVQNDDFVAQPDFYLTYANFGARIWGSMDMTDRAGIGIDSQGEFSELDYVLQYTIPTRLVDLSFGYAFYTYPNTPDELREPTQELYGRGTFNVFLKPTIELYHDMDEVHGWYGRVSATYTQPQYNVDWKLRGSIGFASEEFSNFYFGAGQPIIDGVSFCDLEVRLFTTFNLGSNFGVTPFIGFSCLLDSDLRGAYPDEEDNFFGGLNVSWTF